MTSTRPKSKKTGTTIEKVQGKKAYWEVYSYKKNGKTFFGNRLVSKNGWIVCSNDGFISRINCLKNIEKVKTLA